MHLMATHLCVRVVVGVGRWLAGLAPEPLRSELRGDGAVALGAVCESAVRARGWRGLAWTAWTEWGSLLVAGLRARAGRRGRITGGRPRPPDPRRRGVVRVAIDDLRQAWRGLAASRATVALAVVTLALGIGINSAIFSILDSILWRPVPFVAADRLVELMNVNTARGFTYGGFSPALVAEWQAQRDLFDRVEAYDRASFVYTADGGAEMVPGSIVTPGLPSLLGVAPRLGRLFTPGDGRGGTDRIAIVSDRFWRRRLHRDPQVIGSTISLNGAGYTVIGVMPESFRFPTDERELWVPYDVEVPPSDALVRPTRFVPFARLHPDVTFERASSETTSRGGRLSEAAGGNAGVSARMLRPARLGDNKTRRSLVVLGGAVAFLMLIVCANVANLALARTLTRTRDLAIRAALGASRGDLVRQALVEQTLIGLAGVAGGVAVGYVALAAALGVLPEAMTASTLNAIDLDGRALACAVALGLASVFVFGLPPAIVASRARLADALHAGARTFTGGAAARRFRAGLVTGEVAVSIVLLVAAAVLTRSLLKLQAVDHGFDTANLVSVTLGLPAAGYQDPAVRDRLAADLATRVRGLPGIAGATVGGLPSEVGAITVGPIEFSARPGQLTDQMILPQRQVPPEYFAVLGLPLRRGRVFRAAEPDDTAIVSERFATRFWPDREPIGERFRVGDQPWRTVVGVVGDVRLLDDSASQTLGLYAPVGQDAGVFRPTPSTSLIADYRTLLVRATDPTAAIAQVRTLVRSADPSVVIWRTDLVDHVFADAIARPRVIFLLMSVLAGFGLVLASAGLYGVLSCLVTQRLREIGIRLAVGATARDIGRLVFGTGLVLTVSGLVVGLAAAVALVRVMRTLLFEVEPSDPVALAAVSAVVILASMAASWRPIRRAMRADPVTLLRE
jgi:predicted permease